jgi:UDP-GlcNAc3NAcA epimerase
MRTLSIVGARPQFIKIAPVCRAIERFNRAGPVRIDDLIVHTGQHYDDSMSAVFFAELRIPPPAINLEIGSGSHAEQTGRMLMALEKVILETNPDAVVVYGDTNSTLAGALAAAKLRVPVAHVEAGLRSFNRAMPEEINRIASDHISDILFAPTRTAMVHLGKEGLEAKSVLSGDVMLDAVAFNRTLTKSSAVLGKLGIGERGYSLATIHRAENTSEGVLFGLVELLNELAEEYCPIVWPIHPRTRNVLQRAARRWHTSGRLHVIEPVGYLENLYLIEHSRLVLTDSGGVQKEALFLNAPCVTLRTETEWPETVECGANRVVGTERASVLDAVRDLEDRLKGGRPDFSAHVRDSFGDGRASESIVEHLAAFCDRQGPR